MREIQLLALPLQRSLLILFPVRISCLLSCHVVNPAGVRFDLLFAIGKLVRKVQPAERVANSADLITDIVGGVVRHGLVRLFVSKEVVEVVGDDIVFSDVDEEPGLAVLDLQRNSTAAGGDDGNPVVQGLRNLDFEPFTSGKLERDLCVSHEDVEDLIGRSDAHHDDVVFDVGILLVQGLFCVVEDDSCIGIIDRAVAGDDELGNFLERLILHVFAAQNSVRSENIRDSLRWVETSNLGDVLAFGESELVGTLVHARHFELMHIVLCIPAVELLVQTIKPISSGGEIADFLDRHVLGDELANGVADECIALLDVVPDPVPDSRSGCVLLVSQIGTYLDMTSEDDGSRGIQFFGNLDKGRHLRVVDNDDISPSILASSERTTIRNPVAIRILPSPTIENFNRLLIQAKTGLIDALEDVVVVLGDAKDLRLGPWNIPTSISGAHRSTREDLPFTVDVDQS
jgi:hypothetical protein